MGPERSKIGDGQEAGPRSVLLRRPALGLAASLFVVVHAAAIALGPAPPSYLSNLAFARARPYLEAIGIHQYWAFFAPDPWQGAVLRYEVEDAGGTTRVHPLQEATPLGHPARHRLANLYAALGAPDSRWAPGAVRFLCRAHAADDPVRITLLAAVQLPLTPEAARDGARPLDGEHERVERRTSLRCDAS